MNITQIENLISQIASSMNYNSFIASEQQGEKSIEALPAAWIQLPKVLYVEGREQGIIGHSIVVTLLDNYKGFSHQEQIVRLEEMQEEMIEIMTQLSTCEGVVELSDMVITPKTIPSTRHDSIGQICQATIVTYF